MLVASFGTLAMGRGICRPHIMPTWKAEAGGQRQSWGTFSGCFIIVVAGWRRPRAGGQGGGRGSRAAWPWPRRACCRRGQGGGCGRCGWSLSVLHVRDPGEVRLPLVVVHPAAQRLLLFAEAGGHLGHGQWP